MYEKLCAKVLPRLIPPGSRVLAAVSGGPDSMALAHVLQRFAGEHPERGLSLVLSHIHHGVRAESDQEAEMVLNLAREWGVECVVHRFNAKQYAARAGESFQAGARSWRYERFREDREKYGCNLLATGHHLGDQGETVLYRLMRGSGTAGLAGIYPESEGIIRPLLTVRKEEILEYCRREGLPYAIDRSNQEPVYVRNKIRLELLPELEQGYNPRVLEALGHTARLCRWDEEYIQSRVNELWDGYCLSGQSDEVRLSLEVFREPPAILSRLLRKAAAYVSKEPRGLGYNYVEAIMERGPAANWKRHLPGLLVEIERAGIRFCPSSAGRSSEEARPENDFQPGEEVRLIRGQWVEAGEAGVEVGWFAGDSPVEERCEARAETRCETPNEIRYETIWDLDKLSRFSSPLVLRTRRSGDTMWFRQVGHKSLKKVYQEAGVSAGERGGKALIAAGSDVLWIPGVAEGDLARPEGPDARCKVIFRRRER